LIIAARNAIGDMGIVVYPPSNAIEVFEWLEANYLACARPLTASHRAALDSA
jgi:hypothetical protein